MKGIRVKLLFQGLVTVLLLAPIEMRGAFKAAEQGTVASWSFDEADGNSTREAVTNSTADIAGYFKRMAGISGRALRFDGYTTGLVWKAKDAPRLPNAFSIEAWVAVGAYPWNWLPIVEQRREDQAGYSFGIDSFGHFGLELAINGQWERVLSKAQLPLRKWAQISVTLDPNHVVTLYLDGTQAGTLSVGGNWEPAYREDLRIGRVREAQLPAQWIHPKYPVWYSFDGLLDEIRIFDHCLSADGVARRFETMHAPDKQVLPWPVLPSGPPGKGRFGAYHAHLAYEDIWDGPRRVGPDSDVVIRFDQSPIRLVFWQGTNYIPAWVTENGKWYTDEFLETGGREDCPGGEDCEPMSDKQNRYSHVRVLQSNDARAIIHWRYALCEVEHYAIANVDPYTGWSDWADEYYTVYPDGSAVRKQVIWTSNFKKSHEFQETIVINQPGTRPEDNIAVDALTLANMNGEQETYRWPRESKELDKPANPNIQIVNLKSTWKPFQIVFPAHAFMTAYTGEKSYSLFEWWNHWPVAQVASSGISAVAPDRASHSSLSHIHWDAYAQTENSMTKIMLHGLSNTQPQELVSLARSWITPPLVAVIGNAFRSDGYDATQRAFVFSNANPAENNLSFSLKGSAQSPIIDPVFIVKNWGQEDAAIRIDGHPVNWAANARRGHESMLENTDLIVWLRLQTNRPARFELSRVSR
jgi:hypothetical protein